MTEHGPVDAIVLAGGASRRMGRDKVLLEVEGERLVDRVVSRVASLGGTVVVAAGPDRPLVVPRATAIVDDPGRGPMGGVAAALALGSSDVVVVVAADQPHVDADLLQHAAMRVAQDPSVAAAVPWVDGHPQVLHAAYRRTWLTTVVGTSASLRAALRDAGSVVRLEPADWPGGPQANFARDWDTPEDVADDLRQPSGG